MTTFRDKLSEAGFTFDGHVTTGSLEAQLKVIRAYHLFGFDDGELERYEKWKEEHDKVCPFYDDGTQSISPAGAIGGTLTYQFTPTGLGTVVVVTCACKAKINLTDFDHW